MSMMTYHLQFLLLGLAGWVNRYQQAVIDYVREENRVLREQLRGKRADWAEALAVTGHFRPSTCGRVGIWE